MNDKNPVQRATEVMGGIAALATALGISRQAVQRWCVEGQVPARRVLKVEALTKVKRHELNPEVFKA